MCTLLFRTLVNKCDVCVYVATDSSDLLEHKMVHDEMILEGTTVPHYNSEHNFVGEI